MRIRKPLTNKLFWGIVIHAIVLWLALALGYNSYKKIMWEIAPLTKALRGSIKATFPWAILIFSGLYFIGKGWRREVEGREKIDIFLAPGQYVYVITFYAILLNLFSFSKGRDVLIPLNLSILYFVIILLCLFGLKRLVVISNAEYLPKAQDWLTPKMRAYVKEKPSALFVVGFMILLTICAFLLILKAEKAAEQLANVAYFSLVVGVGIELYQMIKHKNTNEEKKD